MDPVSFEEALREIESFGIMPDRPPSLGPTRRALEELGLIRGIPAEKAIVVAGTNGKGTTCATLEALLLSASCSVGLYTSPHLETILERFRINGEKITETDFLRSYLRIRPCALRHELSHFEVLTLMAAELFHARSLDYFIFEVGLGGLWDATNAIPHSHAIITRLGLDHQNLLGSTLSEIARNKFGIIPESGSVVHAPLPDEVKSLARETQARTRSQWREQAAFEFQPLHSLRTAWGAALLALPGLRSAENATLALTAFEKLGFDPSKHLQALSRVNWPGRMERVDFAGAPCAVYLSGDHNPQGVQSLLELLAHYPRRRLHILVGVGRDKDEDGVLSPLFGLPDVSVHLTVTPFRGKALQEYKPRWREKAHACWESPVEGLHEILRRAMPEDMILVTGSLYLVGELRSRRVAKAET